MTPQEFISKWAGENTRANELMQDDFASAISAAVAAEHQRTLAQCAKVVESVYIGSSQHRIIEAIRALP